MRYSSDVMATDKLPYITDILPYICLSVAEWITTHSHADGLLVPIVRRVRYNRGGRTIRNISILFILVLIIHPSDPLGVDKS